MGKTVLYWMAALVLGGLMVVMPIGIGLSTYVLATDPDEVSPEAFTHAFYTGFAMYLFVLWAVQETFQETLGSWTRVSIFIVAPIGVVFLLEASVTVVLIALICIATLAAYQALIHHLKRQTVA